MCILLNMIFRFLFIMCFLFLWSCSQQKGALYVAPEEKQLVELSDMFQTGHALFHKAVSQDTLMNRVWQDRAGTVVMVLIDIEFDDGEKEQIQQSGVLIGEGRLVLTAGHGFIVDEGQVIATRIIAGSDRELAVTLVDLRFNKVSTPVEDWAILKLFYPSGQPAISILSGKAAFSERVMVLGYPGALGLSGAGIVERVDQNLADPKGPLGVICDRQRFDRYTIFPIVGSIPVRGISGSPIFDGAGNLIGLFSSMGRRRSLDTWQYIFGMSEIPWKRIRELGGK